MVGDCGSQGTGAAVADWQGGPTGPALVCGNEAEDRPAAGESPETDRAEPYSPLIRTSGRARFLRAAAISGRRACTETPRVPPEKPSM